MRPLGSGCPPPGPGGLLPIPSAREISLEPSVTKGRLSDGRAAGEWAELTPGKVWPPRDEGIHVVAQARGVRIGVRGMELTITDEGSGTARGIPLVNIESLSILGSVQISTQAVHALADRGVPVAFLSSAGRLITMIDPLDSASANIRRAQIHKLDKAEACLEFARALITAKIANQRTLLMRNHASLPESVPRDMSHEASRAALAASLDVLRGHEGRAAALYFGNFTGMIRGPLATELDANGRQRRPPPDPINSCLSLAYTIPAHECVAALRVARLEPTVGGFHSTRPGRPAFALDLMEPFPPAHCGFHRHLHV